ncbi:MAG: TonB family protein [Acidobacteriota bacterium]
MQITVVAGIGILLPSVLPLRLPQVALRYWQALLLVSVLLPAVQPWKQMESAVSRVDFSQAQITASRAEAISARLGDWPIAQMAGWVLLAGIAWRLTRMCVGLCQLRSYRRRARPLQPLPAAVQEMQRRLKVRSTICLSSSVDMPVTFGIRPAVVLLPANFTELDPSAQTAITCHELLHVQRRDWTWTLGEELIRAFFWFHPLVRATIARIQLAREQVVDQEVVRVTGDRRLYLEALLQAAVPTRKARLFPSPLFLKESQLAARVALMLQEVSMSKRQILASVFVMSSVLFVAAGVAAWSFPLAVSQSPIEEQSAPAQPAQPPQQSTPQEKSKAAAGQMEPAEVAQRTPVTYPMQAKEDKVHGEVVAQVTVDENGSAVDVEIVSGHELLREATAESLKQWKFFPARLDGKPVRSQASVEVHFVLKDSPSKSAEPLRLKADAAGPKLIHKIDPVYPAKAKRAGVEGSVILQVTINAQGEVSEVRLERGHELLKDAAMEAVRQWRYRPTLLNGNPIAVVIAVTIEFKLEE